ncbi:hypothetical protein Taro_030039 [Colocasia esculenta]|uniref:Uncharacterized protein n=1 Tax=Colocasia esculenta TaxID=4460 RepID=A0A843VLF3_COLES|nr:hypothetical protein [Colocasia esculenta]
MAPHAAAFQAVSHSSALHPPQPRPRRCLLGPPCRVPCGGLVFPGSAQPRLESCRRLAAAKAAASPPPPSDMVGSDQRAALERCFRNDSAPVCSLSTMKGQYGAFGAVTLEKSKLDLSQKTTRTSPETSLGGGGGDIGKRNSHGGGDGGDDGGDDDDYFGDFDDFDEGDDGGIFRRRLILQELFDRKFVDAVLQEWYKTMINLPAGLRQAYEMGFVSSAQMVRFLAINARPTITRFISRALPESLSREFIGRMIADPSFLYKLLLEQIATIGCSVWWELKNRKGRCMYHKK